VAISPCAEKGEKNQRGKKKKKERESGPQNIPRSSLPGTKKKREAPKGERKKGGQKPALSFSTSAQGGRGRGEGG